ncbi:proton-conducting transporter transmembrane domain-containing protein [Halanaerobacter jeridensis]|uniref:Multicomponent Na+:H+ antiporter subunit D n=1 Tax=Halanaerobacter jeridensis TaxID=706427 RepID=A0A938XW10_9FIRM|nr:proton-conducting transporter membrane subunit [Halanaerobacter jeridensis]MBM7556652.1 multicomponent Na+:H+ antiporter subunit D [Halanaerobacter jeridensis]
MINPGIIYLIASIILYMSKEEWRKYFALITAVSTGIILFALPQGQYLQLPFLDFEMILLEVTAVNRFIGFIFVFFSIAAVIYGINLFSRKDYCLTYFYIGSSLAIIFVGDFFSFYICWELMTISSYFLIFNNQKPVTRETSYYYFVMHLVGAISLLWGILLHYSAVGTMALTTVKVGLPFFILAVAIKLAFIGFHTWLPKTYAETPFYISVILSAYTTKVGVYSFYKLLGSRQYLAYAGIVTAVIGVLLALSQTKVRKLLSYHIISQIGYMIVGLSVGTAIGKKGGLLHLANNILYKGLLFMIIGAVIYSTKGEEDLINLGSLFKKLPYTTVYVIIAAVSIAGIPFFNGHISKLLLKKGTNDPILVWGMYIAAIGTSLSFLKILYFGFFKSAEQEIETKQRPTKGMLVGMGLLAAACLIIGLRPQLLLQILGGVKKEVNYFSLHYLWVGLQPTLLAAILLKLAYQWVKPQPHKSHPFDLYKLLGRGFNYFGSKLSQWHNGNLQRYILWILTALVLLWGQALI